MLSLTIFFRLCRFLLEIHWHDGEQYPPSSLHQLCCGLFLRHLRAAGRVEANIFEPAEFHMFNNTLDSEMKCLNSTGQYNYMQATGGANYCGR